MMVWSTWLINICLIAVVHKNTLSFFSVFVFMIKGFQTSHKGS